MFEALCDALGAHLARTFGAGDWALITDGELSGAIDALDWLQYFGPAFGEWLRARKPRGMTKRTTAAGAQLVTVELDPLAPSWVTRQDAARDIYLTMRALPASALQEIDPEVRLQQTLPPEPVQWAPHQRVAMRDARVATMRAVESGMADRRLFAAFRDRYFPARVDEPLLDRIATWLPHYGAEPATAAFRSIARLHTMLPEAGPIDVKALEGCVKIVAWGGDEPLAVRERLLEHAVSLQDPVAAHLVRESHDRDVAGGLLKLTAAMMRMCECPRCQEFRAQLGPAT